MPVSALGPKGLNGYMTRGSYLEAEKKFQKELGPCGK
jgi:hypothetical protein